MHPAWYWIPLFLLAAPRCQRASPPLATGPDTPPGPSSPAPPDPNSPVPPAPDTGTAPPEGAGFSACGNLPQAARTVNVSSSTELGTALAAAQPGDRIVMAPGAYSKQSWADRHGTSSSPIVLCGPRTAVITGDLRPSRISWWIFQGFTSRGAFQAFYAKGITNTRLQGLEIYDVDQEAVHFLCNSTDNVLRDSHVHDTGLTKPSSGEAVYLGTYPGNLDEACGGAPDRSDRNQVLDNRFGPNVPSEDVDAKEGTSGGIIRGNVSDGTGKRAISGHFEASIALKARTSGYVVEDNVLDPAAQDGSALGNGIYIYSGGTGHQVRGNTINMRGAGGYGIRVGGGEEVVSCDNNVVAGRPSNVGCS
jgi:hypothetical protein